MLRLRFILISFYTNLDLIIIRIIINNNNNNIDADFLTILDCGVFKSLLVYFCMPMIILDAKVPECSF